MTGFNKQKGVHRAGICLATVLAIVSVFIIVSCKNKDIPALVALPGYDLNNPVKYKMPDDLTEISGFAFYNGKSDSVYAQQDEEGYVFYFKPGDKKASYTKFAKNGDYEDMAICHNMVIVLKSDGVLFTFPFNQVRTKQAAQVQKIKDVLPTGEFEGLYADEKSGLLYVLCKHCADDKTTKSSSGYILKLQPNGTVIQAGDFSVDVKAIEKLTDKKRVAFHPSALTKNPVTGDWYILSSVNKILVIADAGWKIKNVYPLNVSMFNQPEGIAFDKQRNLYISNEGDQVTAGNILKFSFMK